jgi:hypothetical protein
MHVGVRNVTRRLAQQIVGAVFVVALLLAPLASLSPTEATPTGGNFHWARQSSQFTLQVGSNLSGPWPSILRDVVSDWNSNETLTFSIVSGGTNPQECRPVTGRVEACNWRYGTQVGWLGLTRLYFNAAGDHVESATVQMNDSFFDTASEYNNDAARRHTMCHEIGHTAGLDHVDTESCMNDSQQAVFGNLQPINKDFKQLERIYVHSDSTSTVAGAQAKEKNDKKTKNTNKNKNKKKSGKKNDKRNRRARAPLSESVTVETTDEGRKVVTFITWAGE